MNEAELNTLVKEMRDDYQIPPYHPDSELKNYAKEGEMHLGKLNSGCSITEDLMYRSLLKNYMYYAFYHKTSEFFENYGNIITTWQMETEV